MLQRSSRHERLADQANVESANLSDALLAEGHAAPVSWRAAPLPNEHTLTVSVMDAPSHDAYRLHRPELCGPIRIVRPNAEAAQHLLVPLE
jgi:hypothetical protein